MPTANDLIESAAIKLGAIQTGEALTADEASDCLDVLNSWLDFLAIDKMMVYQIVQNSYSWPSGQSSRTIGPTGNFVATRPIKVEEGTYFSSSGIDYPVEILQERKSYDSISSKSDQGSYPDILYYDRGYPNGRIYVYPVPSTNLTLNLNTWQILQSFPNLTTDLALPQGYRWMIENNLAVALEPVFTIPCPDSVKAEAMKSMAKIKQMNHIRITSYNDVAGLLRGGDYEVYSDTYR